ncbi:MAG TPA: transcription elongation factor GreA [Candidatus Ornithoclostridium excrementipullorum]|nr:transcription elongation factor GreA [Candidatus Ornithoclostridium excrementipullorum]
MAKDFVLTQEGYNKLKEQLDYLKNVRRKEASERIKQARELGDLSENAEYDSAKEEQGIIEADIKRIEDELERAVIIEDPKSSNKVTLGCTVRIREDGEEEEFQIVGTAEADIKQNKISNNSPLAEALLGRKKGEKIIVAAVEPYEVEIVEIRK